MQQSDNSYKFWLGNGILVVAMVVLLFIDRLWALMGVAAMGLWIVLAGAGAYCLLTAKENPGSNGPG